MHLSLDCRNRATITVIIIAAITSVLIMDDSGVVVDASKIFNFDKLFVTVLLDLWLTSRFVFQLETFTFIGPITMDNTSESSRSTSSPILTLNEEAPEAVGKHDCNAEYSVKCAATLDNMEISDSSISGECRQDDKL